MGTFKILAADNDLDYLKMLTEYQLKPAGYHVFQATNPQEARQILEEQLIHLALVDVRLIDDGNPNDTSGLQLCKAMEPMVARIIITAYLPETWDLVRDALKPTEKRLRVVDGFVFKHEAELLLPEIQRVLQEEFEIIPERRIAVLTSGGDSPGMNAAIWAIVRKAMDNDIEVVGVQDGYEGLVNDRMYKLTWNSVSDIMEKGGTILGTARYPEFRDPKVREKAADNIIRKHISGLIVIGGDGSMKGAQALAQDLAKPLQTVAIPGTIDNDLWGTDMSLGAASAANAMIEELRNMIRPAQALRRIFVVEVMGRYSGYLALQAALGIGADALIIPEQVVEVSPNPPADPGMWRDRVNLTATGKNFLTRLEGIADLLKGTFAAGKRYGFIVLAEGIKDLTGGLLNGEYVQRHLENQISRWTTGNRPDVRVQVLGYPVRGAPPSRFDMWLGARLGAAAVQSLLDGKTNVMVGWTEQSGIIETPFDHVVRKSNRPPREIWNDRPKWQELLELCEMLACPPKLHKQLRAQGNHFVRKQGSGESGGET